MTRDTLPNRAAPTAAALAVREFFTLREAEMRATRIPEALRDDLAEALRRASESRAGTEVLWTNGAPALALRLAKESWSSAVDVARRAASTDASPSLAETLAELGLSDAQRGELLAVDAMISALPLPAWDGDVTAEHARAVPRINAALAVLMKAVGRHTLQPAAFARARRMRAAYAIAVVAGLLAVAAISLGIKWRTTATASGSHSIRHEPFRVVDGLEHTEWLLPDNTPGWLDLHLGRRRAVKQVRLLNSHADWFNDRATREYQIELWDRNQLVKKYDGAFAELSPTPQPVTVPVSSDGRKISRIRIHVKSWFKTGGGLAEAWID